MQKELAFCYSFFSPGHNRVETESDGTERGKGCLPEKTQFENKVWLLLPCRECALVFRSPFHPASAPMS